MEENRDGNQHDPIENKEIEDDFLTNTSTSQLRNLKGLETGNYY